MKRALLQAFNASLLLALPALGEEPSWALLQESMQKALGDEWTVASDFHSFTAIRRNVKVLNTLSRIDPTLTERDPWENAPTIDYVISVSVRPKLSKQEYDELARVREKWIATRSKGVAPGSKDSYGIRKEGESAIALPKFFFGSSAIYVTTSAPSFFKLRPDAVSVERDRLLAILKADCHAYEKAPEQE